MKEFLIFVENDTLLPVLYGELSKMELEEGLKNSVYADRATTPWNGLVDNVMNITYATAGHDRFGNFALSLYIFYCGIFM